MLGKRAYAQCAVTALAVGMVSSASGAITYSFLTYPWPSNAPIQPQGVAYTSDGVTFEDVGGFDGGSALTIADPATVFPLSSGVTSPTGEFYNVSDVLSGDIPATAGPAIYIYFMGGATSVSFDAADAVVGDSGIPYMTVYSSQTGSVNAYQGGSPSVTVLDPGYVPNGSHTNYSVTASQLHLTTITSMEIQFGYYYSGGYANGASPTSDPIAFGISNFSFTSASSGSGGTPVSNGGSFAGISSTSGSGATKATIRSGSNVGAATTVAINYTGSSNFSIGSNGGSTIGDSFTLSGTNSNIIMLDVFVNDPNPLSTPPMLLWQNSSGTWVPAYMGNSPTTTGSEQFANGVSPPDLDATAFATLNAAALLTPFPSQLLGDYGAVYENGGWDVWMVIDHNSTFAVGNLTGVPEPALLGGMAMIVPMLVRRRRV